MAVALPKSRPWNGVRRYVVFGFAAAAIVLSSGVAWAFVTDNLVPIHGGPLEYCKQGSPGDQPIACQTDNAQIYYFMQSSLEQRDKDVVTHVLNTQYAPTVLDTHYDGTPKYDGSGETDIIYQEAPVPGSDDGFTWCNDPTHDFGCDQQYVRIAGGGEYTNGLTCHETGHAVGLVHGQLANPPVSNQLTALRCMRKTVAPDDILGQNNFENIQGTY
ncbi:MAG TPA: hypothetical protein VFJ19_06420 [Nocardioidaceae bacterium]|nr:hypothetical protein [Nocardioidaceae bacterium]